MARSYGNILIVDDDEFVLLSIKLLLEPHFQQVQSISNPERIPALLERDQPDVVVLDMNFRQGDTTGHQGLFWLRKIIGASPDTQVILMTAFADVSVAVESIRDGALDFVVKPWQNEKLLATVRAATVVSQEKRKVRQLKSQQKSLVTALNHREPIIGQSAPIQAIRKTIDKVAPTEATVLILGQNGTGKEVVAREIHARSLRSEGVFMSVDMGSLSETLFESELFGHRKGAFTDAREDRVGRFEAANGGVIFLDEIGNLSPGLQAKLLTVLQRKQVVRLGSNQPIDLDVRVVAATNRDLKSMVAAGTFREDLLYRLNTVEITLPSLFERIEDIPLLVNHFLHRFAQKYHKTQLEVPPSVMTSLSQYTWPGNVRELQHAVERGVIMSEGNVLTEHDFAIGNIHQQGAFAFERLNLEKIEEWAIRKALAKHGGNVSHAAEELGLSRGALYRRMETYGI